MDELPQMTLDQALGLVDQACAQFQGNRIQHANLITALGVIRQSVGAGRHVHVEGVHVDAAEKVEPNGNRAERRAAVRANRANPKKAPVK